MQIAIFNLTSFIGCSVFSQESMYNLITQFCSYPFIC